MQQVKTYIGKMLAAVLLLSGSFACTRNFDELNTDPNAFDETRFDPAYLLTSAQLAYTGSTDLSYDTWRANLIYCSAFMQQFATVISYWAGDKYLFREEYSSAYWSNPNGTAGAYPEQVKPIVHLVEATRNKEQYHNLHQIARLMKALIFQRLTDLYGDIPYSEAGLGYYQKIPFPKYDLQKDIYKDLLFEIEDAVEKLDPLQDQPAGDALFKGNIVKWQRFGYSLLLRAGMRLTKRDEATAKAIALRVQGRTMQSNDDNAVLFHDGSGGRVTANRNSQVLLGGPERDFVKWSRTFIDLLKSTGDPRLTRIASTRPVFKAGFSEMISGNHDPSVQNGHPNGRDFNGAAPWDISMDSGYTSIADYSGPSQYLRRLDGPTFILTYGETELLLAEAAARWEIGSAETHYRNGVVAAMTCLSAYDPMAAVDETAALDYIQRNPLAAGNPLERINQEYWIHCATLLDFYESWSNWRRPGFPRLTPVSYPNNATGSVIPRRFPYPAFEAQTNPEAYRKASDAVPGGDYLTGRVWWDQ